jgi:hypothetical protein
MKNNVVITDEEKKCAKLHFYLPTGNNGYNDAILSQALEISTKRGKYYRVINVISLFTYHVFKDLYKHVTFSIFHIRRNGFSNNFILLRANITFCYLCYISNSWSHDEFITCHSNELSCYYE